ncbi:MAG TPA: S-methyl-5-thioribose-1-phosphate isomerase, partial [Methylophilaceae bacterium]|nr:S-methyl-5-thioribose-1-phosphate isomerase [Methylophilaceae bacterium]
EVSWIQGRLHNGEIAQVNLLPDGSGAVNPAFDVTPARLVTGIITEHGVIHPDQLRSLFP